MKFYGTYLIAVPHQMPACRSWFRDNSNIICEANLENCEDTLKTLRDAKEFLTHDYNSSHWFNSTQSAIYCFVKNYNHHQINKVRKLILDVLRAELNLEIEEDISADYKYSSSLDLEFYLIADSLQGEKILNKSKNFEYIIKKAKEAEKKLWEDENFESLYDSVKILIKEK